MTGRSALLTSATLACFAANSLLCRAALAPGLADAASFTLVRLVAGALALALLARLLPGSVGAIRGGSWASALALSGYALAFSFAYLRLDAGVGALVLFAAVQAGMIGSGLWRGERPRPREWAGLGLALSGLAGLARPGRTAPDPLGLGLMALAGLAWAAYTLRGRSAPDPLAATADNFRRSVPFGPISRFAFGVSRDGVVALRRVAVRQNVEARGSAAARGGHAVQPQPGRPPDPGGAASVAGALARG